MLPNHSFQDSLVDSTIVESKPSSASQQPEQMMDYFSVGLASSVAPSDESPISSEMHPNTPTRPTSTRLPSYLEDLVKGGLSNRSNRRSSVSSSSTPKADKWAGIFSLRRKSIVNDVNDVPPRSRSASFPSLHFSTSTSKSKQRPADGLASPPSPSEQEPFQGRNKVDSGYLSFSSVDSNTNVMSGLDAIHDLDDLDEHLESPIGSPRPLHPYDPSPPISETDISVFDRLRIDTAEVIQFADGNGRVVGSGNVENDLPAEFSLITAATVEKLVEKLTKDIDYTFMTDFFLTFRLFLSPVRLCKLLILRFRWALQGDLEEHQLVRIRTYSHAISSFLRYVSRTFVVIRHWLTFYFTQDFITSRTLRFMTTTFLNDMRVHPVILSSQRDERIIRSLRTVLKKQRKTYMDRSEGDALVLESQHHGVAERPGPSRTGLSGTRQRLQRALTSLPGSIMTGQAALNASKDSDKASKTSFMSSKNSASSSGTSLSPRRAAPTTSQRSVRESNAWSVKMTFGISSIKRKVPAMYQSIVNSKNLSASSIVEPECRPEGCCCSVDIMQASKSTSTVMIDENESWRTSPKSGAVPGSPGSRNGSLFRMKTGKNFGTLTSRGSASDDSISSIKFVEEPTSMEPENLRPSILRAFSSPPSQNRPSKVTRSITSQDSMVLVHTNPSCPFFDADQLPTQSGATPLSSSNELLPIHGILGEFSLPNSPTLSPQMPYRSFVLLYRSEVIAQQFCILERRLLRDVTWEELIELRWTKKKPEHSVNEEMEEPKKKRGVDALIERFDSVCQWVTSEIVRTKSIDLRVKVVEKFIRIALVSHIPK
ncbi:hypothetical protein BC938DRAFT_471934 [Jimgerdemannia flammicorona]|uniref:N-terminal Ras-GEF domain-containing protein n=1 Tax=Jimgerdemannia flammicorona TaxID=994334 RepID=A0A433Q725_9FUNG|nr:hypothetical protein BC938DRAFT_471934 [Jimgerdemannia flammicorona]